MKHSLTLYALDPSVTSFDDAVRPDALDSPQMRVHHMVLDLDFEAQLYHFEVQPTPPTWAGLLESAFPSFEAPPSAMAKVLVILRLTEPVDRYFAVTFGSGRFLLKSKSYQPNYGLKVALNSIYEGDSLQLPVPSDRLRVVQTTTVGTNTVRTLRQTNRNAAFQDFEVDLQRDQIGRVVGAPLAKERWGSRMTGSDSIRVTVIEEISALGQLCRDLADLHSRDDFKLRFSAIEDIRSIPDDEVAGAEARLLKVLQTTPEQVSLAPTEILDWDEVDRFRLSLGDLVAEELTFSSVLEFAPEDADLLDILRRERIECLDAQGQVIAQCPLFEALDVELELDGETILLMGGDFYVVSRDYLDELHRDLSSIRQSSVSLPPSFTWVVDGKKKEESEGDYNERAALETGFALMDKKTVRLDRGGDPIEVCDLFSSSRQLIHVKRKFSSSSLSHLFGQGSVSGDLFLANPEYRQKFTEKLQGTTLQNLVPVETPDSRQFEVVYAIIGPWEGKELVDRLPFFSKINLRRHASDLSKLGFQVTFCPIDLVAAPPEHPPQ